MTTFEWIQVLVGTSSASALVLTLAVMAWQMWMDRRLQQYQVFQRLSKDYTDLLWRPEDEISQQLIWHPLNAERRRQLDAISRENREDSRLRWPVWAHLDQTERKSYQVTRAGLELFEQAHTGYHQSLVSDKQVWAKWESWMHDWVRNNSFVEYVLDENNAWFTDRFIAYMHSLQQTVEQVEGQSANSAVDAERDA